MNNKTVERLEQIKFEKMEVILQILGFIESKGTLFQKDTSNLTREKIEDLLLTIGHPVKKKKNGEEEIPDTRRQINNAQNLFNRLSKTFLIEGDRSGTHFKNLRTGSTDLNFFIKVAFI